MHRGRGGRGLLRTVRSPVWLDRRAEEAGAGTVAGEAGGDPRWAGQPITAPRGLTTSAGGGA